jgi:hypothetical protein
MTQEGWGAAQGGQEWVTCYTEQGAAYFFNTRTGETQWELAAGSWEEEQGGYVDGSNATAYAYGDAAQAYTYTSMELGAHEHSPAARAALDWGPEEEEDVALPQQQQEAWAPGSPKAPSYKELVVDAPAEDVWEDAMTPAAAASGFATPTSRGSSPAAEANGQGPAAEAEDEEKTRRHLQIFETFLTNALMTSGEAPGQADVVARRRKAAKAWPAPIAIRQELDELIAAAKQDEGACVTTGQRMCINRCWCLTSASAVGVVQGTTCVGARRWRRPWQGAAGTWRRCCCWGSTRR